MSGLGGEALRVARLFFGFFIYAVGIVMTIHANQGASPWDVFHLGLGHRIGLTLGNANILTSAAIVVLSALLKERVGLGTLCNMIFIGVFIDVVIASGWIPVMQSLLPGMLMLVAGLFVIALATVFYMGAGYGAGPRDSLMVALSKYTGRSAGFCKGCVEGTALFFGWILGGRVGIGTLISALGIGVAVQIVFRIFRFDVRRVRQESLTETFRRAFSSR